MASVLAIDLKGLQLIEGCIEQCIPNWIERLRLENEGGGEKVSVIQVEEVGKIVEPVTLEKVDAAKTDSVELVDPVVV